MGEYHKSMGANKKKICRIQTKLHLYLVSCMRHIAFFLCVRNNRFYPVVLSSGFLLCSKLLKIFSVLCPVPSVAGPSTSLTTMSLLAKNTPSRSEMTKVQQQVKVNGASMTVLRREMQEIRVKQLEQQKQLQDQEQKLLEQTQVIAEQNTRLAELEHKLRELMDNSTAAMGEPRPSTAVPSTSSNATVASTVASTAVTGLISGSMAPPSLHRESEGEGGSSLKRRRSADLPRQSKRLRSKK